MSETTKTDKPIKPPSSTGQGAKRSAPELGVAGAIIIVWGLKTFAGVEPDAEVTLALGVVIGAIAARIKDIFERG